MTKYCNSCGCQIDKGIVCSVCLGDQRKAFSAVGADDFHEYLQQENENLKRENEALKLENEALKRENERFKKKRDKYRREKYIYHQT
jgi:cell division protein FtsB